VFIFASFWACPKFSNKSSSSKTKFVCIFYFVFKFWRFYWFFIKGVYTSTYFLFNLFLILGFHNLYWIELVLSISKSSSLLKMKSGRKIYHHLCVLSFLSVVQPVQPSLEPTSPVFAAPCIEPYWVAFQYSFPVSTSVNKVVHRTFQYRVLGFLGLCTRPAWVFPQWPYFGFPIKGDFSQYFY
jgi:hypothetical protein